MTQLSISSVDRLRVQRASLRRSFLATLFATTFLAAATSAQSAQLTLTWQDNSSDELGFKIERSINGGAFAEIASVAADVTTYVDTNVTAGSPHVYRVAAYNAIGNSPYSNVATNAPTTSSQPANQTVSAFQSVSFSVTATGVPTPSYQWRRNGLALSNGGIVSGANSNTLVLTGVSSVDAGT